MSTVLIFSATAHGNLFPLLPGLTDLEDRGHTIHMLVPAGQVQMMRDAGFNAEASGMKIDDFERAIDQVRPDVAAIDASNYMVMTWADILGVPACGIGMAPRVARRSLLRGKTPSQRFAAAIESLLPAEPVNADSASTGFNPRVPAFS